MFVIETRRLTLSPLEPDDATRLVELCNDRDIARNTARIDSPYTLEDAQHFIGYAAGAMAGGAEFPFAVRRDGVVVACAGAKPHGENACELGYWVGAKDRGQGVATEAGDAVLQFACARLAPETLTSGHFADNPASGRVLEKLGFKPTGEIMQMHSAGRGETVDTVRLAMPAGAYAPLAPVRIVTAGA